MRELLTLKSVGHDYPQGTGVLDVLRDINLSISKGERIALCGPSGSGKSTLLHIAGLLEQPRHGTVLIEGRAVEEDQRTRLRREKIGFVFQFHHLLPEFTALENIAMPLRLQGLAREEAHAQARDMLAQLGLEARLSHLPAQLSGGEQQRVAVGRALIHKPMVVIADEPTGSLDKKLGDEIAQVIFAQCAHLETGVLLATHDEGLAQKCDRVIRLENGTIQ